MLEITAHSVIINIQMKNIYKVSRETENNH